MADWIVTVTGPGRTLSQGVPLDDMGQPQERPAWGLPKPDMHGLVHVDTGGGRVIVGRLIPPHRGGAQ